MWGCRSMEGFHHLRDPGAENMLCWHSCARSGKRLLYPQWRNSMFTTGCKQRGHTTISDRKLYILYLQDFNKLVCLRKQNSNNSSWPSFPGMLSLSCFMCLTCAILVLISITGQIYDRFHGHNGDHNSAEITLLLDCSHLNHLRLSFWEIMHVKPLPSPCVPLPCLTMTSLWTLWCMR